MSCVADALSLAGTFAPGALAGARWPALAAADFRRRQVRVACVRLYPDAFNPSLWVTEAYCKDNADGIAKAVRRTPFSRSGAKASQKSCARARSPFWLLQTGDQIRPNHSLPHALAIACRNALHGHGLEQRQIGLRPWEEVASTSFGTVFA